jgi:hypothetical protein
MDRKVLFALAAVMLLLLVAVGGYFLLGAKKTAPPAPKAAAPPMAPGIVWDAPYQFGKQGYEPGLVVDSKGYMYYTAHKNMDDKTSWDYLASWFFVGSPDGKTWKSPDQPTVRGQMWKTYAGDEGDIAIDQNDRVYFVDTYLADNRLHVWDSPGVWQYSLRVQKTTGLDDRPWIAAQGDSLCHYLGNNAMVVNGGRYWYYRSTDGGRVWTRATPVPGNGWAHIDAETKGTHAYIISEGDVDVPADILVYRSDDSGQSWNFDAPAVVGHRDGSGSVPGVAANGENVWISSGGNGAVWCLWSCTYGTESHNRIFVGYSLDNGQNWNSSEITPWAGYFVYPTLDVGDDGSVAVAFYGTDSAPVTDQSEWRLYAAMLRTDSPYHPANPAFNATSAAMRGYLQYEANHTRNATNITAAMNNTVFFNFTNGEEAPCTTGTNLHDLHDFFEIAVGPDGYVDIAYQHYIGPANGHSELYFVRGEPGGGNRTAAAGGG